MTLFKITVEDNSRQRSHFSFSTANFTELNSQIYFTEVIILFKKKKKKNKVKNI